LSKIKNTTKNILFLGSFVKKNNTGGSLMIDYILNNFSSENIFWLNTRPNFKLASANESLNIYDSSNNEQLLDSLFNYLVWAIDFNILRRLIFSQKIPFFLSHIFYLFHKNLWSQIQLFLVNKYVRKNDINYCLISLDNDFIIFSHAFIKQTHKNKIISIVSDDPGASLKMYGVPDKIVDNIQKLFIVALKKSNTIAVISEGMQNYYKKLANVSSIITYPVNSTRLLRKEEMITPSTSKIKIIHIGHLRISEIDNLNIFISALNDSIIDYEFYFIGRDADRYELVNLNNKIKILGWVSQLELEQYISTSNYAYVPYSFKKENNVFVSTSFPSKVTSFLKLGIPIIHHGPAISSVSNFINKYGVGFNVNTNDRSIVEQHILSIVNNIDINKIKLRCLEIASSELDSPSIAYKYVKMIDEINN
jgi:hypothetical protein